MEEEKIVPQPEEVKEEPATTEAPVIKEEKKKRRNKLRIHQITKENDIKFRGPLSYRHLRILGWIFLTISSVGVLLGTAANLYKNENMFGHLPDILQIFKDLMGPLFLTAAFSTVIVAKDGYRRLIILYSGLSIIMYLLFLLIFQHYLVGIVSALSPESGQEAAELIILLISGNGFIAFNIFIDLLLCTLVTFFINYKPTVHFQGKKIYIFRSFVALPLLYELGSITLKMLCSTGVFLLSPYVFPLLTTKAPLAFLIFVFMALFIKRREKFFIKKGKTHEDFLEFQNTNLNSFQFAKTLTFAIIVASIIDIIVLFVISTLIFANTGIPEGFEPIDIYIYQLSVVYSWGFGQTAPLLLIIPVILLFDYRKTYKKSMIDTLIPIGGIALMILVYLEGGFLLIKNYLIDTNKNSGTNEPEVAAAIKQLVAYIKYRK